MLPLAHGVHLKAGPPRLCRALAAAPSPALTAPSVVQPPLSLASEVAQADFLPPVDAPKQRRKRVSRRNAALRHQQEQQQAGQELHQHPQGAAATTTLEPVPGTSQSAQQTLHPPTSQPSQEEMNALLETSLKAAASYDEALDYALNKHPVPLQPPQFVFVLSHVARMCDSQRLGWSGIHRLKPKVEKFLARYSDHLPQLSGYELVVLLTSVARTRHFPPTEWLERYFMASAPHVPGYGPGYIYLLLSALQRMDLSTSRLKEAPTYNAWMSKLLATAKAKTWAYRGDELVKTLSVVTLLEWHPGPEWLEAFGNAIRGKIEFLDSRLLSQALVALSKQHHSPDPTLCEALVLELSSRLPMFDDQDLTTTAHAATLVQKMVASEFFADFMVETALKAPAFNPPALAFLLHALGGVADGKYMAPLTPQQQAAATAIDAQRVKQAIAAAAAAAAGAGYESDSANAAPAGVQYLDPVAEYSGRDHAAGPTPEPPQSALFAPRPTRSAPSAGPSSTADAAQPPQPPQVPGSRAAVASLPSGIDVMSLRPIYPDTMSAIPSHELGGGLRVPWRAGAPWNAPLPSPSPAWLTVMSEQVYAQMPHMAVGRAAMALWGLGRLGCRLSAERLDAFFVSSLTEIKYLNSEEVLWLCEALALGGYQPNTKEQVVNFKTWFGQLGTIIEKRLFTPQQSCDMVVALSGLPQAPSEELLASVLLHTRRNRPTAMRHMSPRRLARLITALRLLRYRPDFGFCHAYAQAVRIHYHSMAAQDITAVMCGLATIAPSPLAINSLWLLEMLALIQCKVDQLDISCVPALLRAVVVLYGDTRRDVPTDCAAPSLPWCRAMFARMEEQARTIPAPQAASILWCVATIALQRSRATQHSDEQAQSDPATSQDANTRVDPAALAGISRGLLTQLHATAVTNAHHLPPSQLNELVSSVKYLGLSLPTELDPLPQQKGVQAATQGSKQQRRRRSKAGKAPAHAAAPEGPAVVSAEVVADTSPAADAAAPAPEHTQAPQHVVANGHVAAHVADAHHYQVHVTGHAQPQHSVPVYPAMQSEDEQEGRGQQREGSDSDDGVQGEALSHLLESSGSGEARTLASGGRTRRVSVPA